MTSSERSTISLNQSALPHLPAGIRIPSYNRQGIKQSIVHIGVGGFFRSHQAVYLDNLLHVHGNAEWGLCGVGLLKHDARMRDVLRDQDGLYSVVERSAAGDALRVIGSLVNFLYAPDDPEAVIEKMAHPDTRIVSLTITEGGYYLNQGTGEFDDTHPDILHDLAHPHTPSCSFGYLAEALHRRRVRGLPPFVVMSCDNIQHNGDVTRNMLLAFTRRRDPVLSAWLERECAFPNSMVDRITPATTEAHRLFVQQRFALNDAWPVMTEPFMQWVIEDRFPLGRPAWEQTGVHMTSDVLPYEKMKLRLLNASHQALCYIGMLLGYQYVHEAMADAQIEKLVWNLMDGEVTPLLPPMQGIDLTAYKKTVLERFSNPTIQDQLARIGTDGSARIPKFVLPSISEQLAQGGPIKLLSFTVACWFRYLGGTDDRGRALQIVDALKEPLCEHAKQGGADPRLLLSMKTLFGDLGESAVFVDQVSRALRSLYEEGAKAALDKVLSP